MQPFIEALNERVILADGAMGTLLYERGVFLNRCYDELNLTSPEIVKKIHLDYLAAGAELIETNTFTANRMRLAPYGLEGKVREINSAGVRLAREASEGRAYVAGSVGPLGVTLAPLGRHTQGEAREIFREQIEAIVEAGADSLVFETFMNMDELEIAVKEAQRITNLPIVAQVSFKHYREGEFVGVTPASAIKIIEGWGVAVGGTNCSSGPQGVLDAVQEMRKVSQMKLIAMPNSGMPQMVEGRMLYLATPEYMGEYARRLVQAGANIIGGCCGTTPAEIKEMARFIKAVTPKVQKNTPSLSLPPRGGGAGRGGSVIKIIPTSQKSIFASRLGKKFAVSVELDPPMGLSAKEAIAHAKFLHEHGVDAVNIADGPRAMARMSPIALATLVKKETGIEPIVHYCCRDRNLLGMQMDLLGAHALELKNLLIITGDPPKMGTYPMATAVFDIDSIGLIHMVNMMNHGRDLTGRELNDATSFLIGCGVNPGAVNIELEVARYAKKIEAGAEYVFSQPVYDPELLERFFKLTAGVKEIPFFVGILPLASLKNAEFLHNEVPGMQIPSHIMSRMQTAKTRDAQRFEGMAIAKEALAAAKKMPRVNGAYVFPPFGKYEAVVELLDY
ncbi:MAG: bifunctional homocysteine S-methyltransferase/methylenetetrahydrofolate reductase [Deltaproteobacteria bacterium RIFCSPLOWO2_02_FULL_47_10]|nr:MAG: bifunctional homocysteine S-methyltransferase/methylenetetrahydrofolate reductase [Deltaproteobacteria bacterium RIFCSPLOWO2_02_FULL_47_10]